MKRALLLAAVVAVTAVQPTAEAAPRGRTFVTHDCRPATIAPRQIMFACGDGGFYTTQGDWTSWHRFRAVGSALFHLNDCSPSCAEGTFSSERAELYCTNR